MTPKRWLTLWMVLLSSALFAQGGRPASAEEYYYGIEINGTLCGYANFTTAPLVQEGRKLVLLEHTVLMQVRALGKQVDSRLKLTYHLEPETNGFRYHDSTVEQGGQSLFVKMRIDGGQAYVSGTGMEKEEAVELPPDVVLENTLFYPHLVADFANRKLESQSYKIFNGRDAKVQDVVYTRVGAETIQRAGKTFETIVLDCLNRSNGLKVRLWLDPVTGIEVQTQMPNRLTYLADGSITRIIQTANLDPTLAVRANKAIPNPNDISYMKVRAVIDPFGLWVSPESLSVPGQRFNGTVKDNHIEGEFEVEHRHYDGSKAPPFPPDFRGDPALKEFLEPSEFIQSADPVLVEKAREITKSSKDSWDAARRIAQWVAENIKGAIPGGGTAKGVYDTRSGECGGYGFLTATFCRAVGIPARVVWGCLYATSGGGVFGQHGWNEIYMGEAGWIPLDTTRREFDYVDSGHIRIGVHQSTATALNARTIEILDYRAETR
jgi:transglutaminase-like putative cysteine protease